MYAVQNEVETIHLYVVRERPTQPSTALPVLGAVLCLVCIAAVTCYSALHPHYEHQRLTVPAIILPLKVFTAEAPIVPTGVKTYPATTAHGMLTLTNGSVLCETLPAGIIFGSGIGAEVQTTAPAFIPAGSASGYGIATVPAKAVGAGTSGNIPTLAINAVYGTALYIRNLSPFAGGSDGYSVRITTAHDIQEALRTARSAISTQQAHTKAILAAPCGETIHRQPIHLQLTASCQYVLYNVPSYMHVNSAYLVGENFIVDVVFVVHPITVRTRFGVGRSTG